MFHTIEIGISSGLTLPLTFTLQKVTNKRRNPSEHTKAPAQKRDVSQKDLLYSVTLKSLVLLHCRHQIKSVIHFDKFLSIVLTASFMITIFALAVELQAAKGRESQHSLFVGLSFFVISR